MRTKLSAVTLTLHLVNTSYDGSGKDAHILLCDVIGTFYFTVKVLICASLCFKNLDV